MSEVRTEDLGPLYHPYVAERCCTETRPHAHYDVNPEALHGSQPDPFEKHLYSIFDDAFMLLLKKHKDYGPKNIALSPGGPLNGLRVRMWDKLARINHLIDSGAEPENESLRDSFIDALCYSAIALMVLDKQWPGVE